MGSCSSTAVYEDQAACEREKHVIAIRERVYQRAKEDLKKEMDAAAKESLINKDVATEFGKMIKHVMSDPVEANAYAHLVGMDANNRRVLQAFATGGNEAGVKALFTSEDGKKKLTYAESRALYG